MMGPRSAARALAASLLLASAAFSQEKGEQIQGVIIARGDHENTVTVRTENHGDVTVGIARRTHVVFGNGDATSIDYLKPGMEVRFKYDTSALDRIHIISGHVPAESPRDVAGVLGQTAGARQELKVRILSIDSRRGELRADAAGRTQTFRARDRYALRGLRTGSLVVVTVEGDTILDIRSAAIAGRVTFVDNDRGEIGIEVDGREQVFGIEDRGLLRRLHSGDRARVEVEERSDGRRVVTRID